MSADPSLKADSAEIDGLRYRLIDRERLEPSRHRTFSEADIRLGLLYAVYRASSFLSLRHQLGIARALPVSRMQRRLARITQAMTSLCEPAPDADAILFQQYETRRFMYYVLEKGGRRFTPRFTVLDGERIRQAQARGRGVILWAENMAFQTHAGKRALYEAGFRAFQLTTPGHGIAHTDFGRRWLNGWQVAVEARYLKGWLRFDPASTEPVAERIEELLRANEIVIIANNSYAGRRFIEVPLAPDTIQRLPTGPIRIAAKTGAALLPAATIEIEPFSAYELQVGEDLSLPYGPEKLQTRDLAEVAARYRAWILPLLRRYPSQWRNWEFLWPAD